MYCLTNISLFDECISTFGKVKVPRFRNVGRSGLYTHNGYFITLEEIVYFYNTGGDGTWPPPEVPFNVNRGELGALGLTPAEGAAIVAFINTLMD